MTQDGSQAYDIKEYLVRQERCLEVKIDSDTFPGLKIKKDELWNNFLILFFILYLL